jgi:hypothetical protein
MAGQAQGITVACHYAVCVAEAAHGVAVAVDHRAELAVFVVAVLSQGFHGLLVDHPFDRSDGPQEKWKRMKQSRHPPPVQQF